MNTSGEAADQVVRMSLEVGEAALKISGTGAKHLAVMLYAVLKEKKKTKGRARLETLVKSGRPLTVFSVKESDLKQFVQEAKRYGVLYCAVRNPKPDNRDNSNYHQHQTVLLIIVLHGFCVLAFPSPAVLRFSQ